MPGKRPISVAEKPVKQSKRFECTLQDKLTILDWHNKNSMKQAKTVKQFQENGFPRLNQPLLSTWLKNEAKLRKKAESRNSLSTKRFKQPQNKQFDDAMSSWIDQLEESEFNGLTGEVIKQVGIKMYDKLNTPEDKRLSLSNGWLQSFKDRQQLKFVRFHGEAASVSVDSVKLEIGRLQRMIGDSMKDGYQLDDIYNFDETSFFYASVPDKGLSRSVRSGKKQSKTRITLGFALNATGTDKLDPVIIGSAKCPRSFKKKSASQLGFNHYYYNKKAWMTGAIFRDWLVSWNMDLHNTGRKIILLIDNFSGHKIDPEEIPNIQLRFFSPNMTSHVQPCDAGIIKTFKAIYRRLFVLRVIDKLMLDVVPEDIFDINILQAMNLAKQAWIQVSVDTIRHCWTHTQILPPEQILVEAEVPSEPEISLLHEALISLKALALNHEIALNLSSADVYVDEGESDELAHCNLSMDEIIANLGEEVESENESDEGECIVQVSDKEAFSFAVGLEQYLMQADYPRNEYLEMLRQIKESLHILLTPIKKQMLITSYISVGDSSVK